MTAALVPFAYTKPIIASPHAISRVLATICPLPLVDSLPSCKSLRKVRSCGHDSSIWVHLEQGG